MGASGDSALYSPYLETLGAATADADGGALSDAIAGAMCWCPITSLNEANAAYEWNMGQFSSEGTRAPGTWTEAYSKDLAAAYAEHVNTMGLTDAAGTALSLEASETGVCLKGSYYDHLVGVITTSPWASVWVSAWVTRVMAPSTARRMRGPRPGTGRRPSAATTVVTMSSKSSTGA